MSQLRSEISEAKSEVAALRREKSQIEEEESAVRRSLNQLNQQHEALVQEGQKVRIDNAKLEEEGRRLRHNIETLREERETYAAAALRTEAGRLLALAENRLAQYEHFAEVAAQYDAHVAWLEANREFAELLPQFLALPTMQQYSKQDPVSKRTIELYPQTWFVRTMGVWSGEPWPPLLEPVGDPGKQIPIYWGKSWQRADEIAETTSRKAGSFTHFDYMAVHEHLFQYLLENTMTSRRGAMVNGTMFIEELKREGELSRLLPSEKDRLGVTLDDFLTTNSDLATVWISLAFSVVPNPQEIVSLGTERLENIKVFRGRFQAFWQAVNWDNTD